MREESNRAHRNGDNPRHFLVSTDDDDDIAVFRTQLLSQKVMSRGKT